MASLNWTVMSIHIAKYSKHMLQNIIFTWNWHFPEFKVVDKFRDVLLQTKIIAPNSINVMGILLMAGWWKTSWHAHSVIERTIREPIR